MSKKPVAGLYMNIEKTIRSTNITVNGFCMNVTFDDSEGNTGDNNDTYKFTIDGWSQGVELFEHNGNKITFGIVGNVELEDFFHAMDVIRSTRKD